MTDIRDTFTVEYFFLTQIRLQVTWLVRMNIVKSRPLYQLADSDFAGDNKLVHLLSATGGSPDCEQPRITLWR